MKKLARNFLATAFASAACIPAMAVLPDSGMWTIGDELDGKPGRGIQVDRQNGTTLIVTYFGYRVDGTSMFLQASGQLQNGKTFTADLIEYKNGRPLGGNPQSGEVAHVIGPVTIDFLSTTRGTVTLPGEAPQPVSRFQFEDHKARLFHGFRYAAVDSFAALSVGYISFKQDGDGVVIREQTSVGEVCTYAGNLLRAGGGFRSEGNAVCDGISAAVTGYRIEDLSVDSYGMLSGRMYRSAGETSYSQVRSLTGVCSKPGAVFITPVRCRPEELGVSAADWAE